MHGRSRRWWAAVIAVIACSAAVAFAFRHALRVALTAALAWAAGAALSAGSALGLPPAVALAAVGIGAALAGLLWMTRITRGPGDAPPWRYRDR
ncbi:MAG TPA: hypothetical protein VIR16_07645 [Candidatus Limnocylindrales bacterium]